MTRKLFRSWTRRDRQNYDDNGRGSELWGGHVGMIEATFLSNGPGSVVTVTVLCPKGIRRHQIRSL